MVSTAGRPEDIFIFMEIVTQKSFELIEDRMREAGFSPERVRQEVSFAIQHINKSKQLKECSPVSLQQAVLNVANIGLTLNPAAKEAYLIPRWNSTTKGMEAALEPSYIGLTKLLTDTGSVKSLVCQLVYEYDKFSILLADNKTPVMHSPELVKSKRGSILGVYALATLTDGTRQVEWMDIEEVNFIRDRSETYKAFIENKIKSCTWETDYNEMSRKTVSKRIYKYLPRTERMTQIDKAIQIDDSDYTISDAQFNFINALLHTCTLPQKEIDLIEMELTVMTPMRANEVINQLQQAQPFDELKKVQQGARKEIAQQSE